MSKVRQVVNIIHGYGQPLFPQHFDSQRDAFDVVENGVDDRIWDLVIVFEAFSTPTNLRVRGNRAVFIAGEPPSIGNHSRAFLGQFDAIFCAGAQGSSACVSSEQHYNNWHFGYSAKNGFRYSNAFIRDLMPPKKTHLLSTVTSNLAYLPMHIKRRALMERLEQDYSGAVDFFGRPHRFVEYKEDAILPYKFHICVENWAAPDLWTEKIADALLGYAVPIYAGCPNIETYFPGATIMIDLEDYASARRTIDAIVMDGESIYRDRLPAVVEARRKLIEAFDISALIMRLLHEQNTNEVRDITLQPEAAFPMAGLRHLTARVRRKVTTIMWRQKVARHG
jgi:hypothetical protein